jgi:anti-sigma regulatory factor (Ser/Thr protein kinase)
MTREVKVVGPPRSRGAWRYPSGVSTASRTLSPTPAEVAGARRFVQQTLGTWGLDALTWTAEQLVSELATNCILHARTAYTIELSRDGEVVRVSVSDGSPAIPRPRRYDNESTTGRGLRLVESLASRWGVDPADRGKSVWFELPATAGLTVGSWDDEEEVDVDALLAQFSDEAEDEPRRAPTGGSAAA